MKQHPARRCRSWSLPSSEHPTVCWNRRAPSRPFFTFKQQKHRHGGQRISTSSAETSGTVRKNTLQGGKVTAGPCSSTTARAMARSNGIAEQPHVEEGAAEGAGPGSATCAASENNTVCQGPPPAYQPGNRHAGATDQRSGQQHVTDRGTVEYLTAAGDGRPPHNPARPLHPMPNPSRPSRAIEPEQLQRRERHGRLKRQEEHRQNLAGVARHREDHELADIVVDGAPSSTAAT